MVALSPTARNDPRQVHTEAWKLQGQDTSIAFTEAPKAPVVSPTVTVFSAHCKMQIRKFFPQTGSLKAMSAVSFWINRPNI